MTPNLGIDLTRPGGELVDREPFVRGESLVLIGNETGMIPNLGNELMQARGEMVDRKSLVRGERACFIWKPVCPFRR